MGAKRVALLTPYTGGNLGDAAIQEAVIANAKARVPDASILLITLHPALTTKLHRVPSFPITLQRIPNYAQCHGRVPNLNESRERCSRPNLHSLAKLKATVARIPALDLAARQVWNFFRSIWRGPRAVLLELRHLIQGYRILKQVDLVMVSGGGQLDDYWGGAWGHPYALFKWGLLARAVGARFEFVCVGTCALESRLGKFFIREALRLSCYRSYRDNRSKELLRYCGFIRDDPVYPDLAFSYKIKHNVNERDCATNCGRIGISPIAYLSEYGWPKKDLEIYNRYFSVVAAFAMNLVQRGYTIVLFASDGPDREVANDIADYLRNHLDHKFATKVRQPRTETLDELFDQLDQLRFVVASRLHGILLSNLSGLPVLAISYDRKVDTYMEDVGLAAYCLDIRNVTLPSLLSHFESLAQNAYSIKRGLEENVQRYASDLQRQYDVIFDGIRNA